MFAHKADCNEIWHDDRPLCVSVGYTFIWVEFEFERKYREFPDTLQKLHPSHHRGPLLTTDFC